MTEAQSKRSRSEKAASIKKMRARGGATLEEFFGPDGPLAEALPNYELRAEQLEVSQAIDNAIKRGKACLAEAGTGVGKTMAYLVPAIRAAMKGKRTIISTHTISLQTQLVNKDIPLIIGLIPGAAEAIKYQVMKGRGNYLCKLALEQSREDIFLSADPLFKKVQKWDRDPDCTGDVADLPFAFSAWSELTSLPEMCPAQQCKLYEACHLYTVRRKAVDSKIIIVNHALFMADLALRLDDPNAGVLPEYECVIFDEAHHLEEVATRTFGIEFGSRRISNLIDRIKRIKDVEIEPERLSALDQLNTQLFTPFQQAGKSEFTVEEAIRPEARSAAEETVGLTCNAMSELQNKLIEAAKQNADIKERLDGLSRMLGKAREELHELFFLDQSEAIRWGEVETARRNNGVESRVSLHLTPISVASVLGPALWSQTETATGTVVLLSATLSNSGGFSYVRQRLGVPEECIECIVGSPFDYKSQALLYVPAHLPAPAPGPQYADLLASEISKVVKLTNGRAFLLFTSRMMMNAVYERLIGAVPFPLYRQGDMPPGRLVEEFKNSGNGCLLGLQTFWEGVDVQGEALTCVIIDKLPFAVPDSPVTRARTKAISEAGGDWFKEFSIPQAQIRLKQGFGRLIRTHSDRGIVCIMDTRLLTRNYGAEFVKYLPQTSRASKWNRVEKFYETISETPVTVPAPDETTNAKTTQALLEI